MNTNLNRFIFPDINEVENLLNQFMNEVSKSPEEKKKNNFPPTDVSYDKQKEEFVIEIIVAKYNKQDIIVETESNMLFIYTNKLETLNDENKELLIKGISKKSFQRAYKYPLPIEKAQYKIENGILEIRIKLIQQETTRKRIGIGE